jgi:hypothetical protein
MEDGPPAPLLNTDVPMGFMLLRTTFAIALFLWLDRTEDKFVSASACEKWR